jgi:peptidoglycan/LPS O-acetylase OafA/YrhL
MGHEKGAVARTQIVGLDLLRFFAAFIVMNFHLAVWSWAVPQSTVGRVIDAPFELHGATPYFWFGWVGVEIFFVISGFVIAMSANGASPYSFARSRAVRLLPGVWICATLSLLVLWLGSDFAHADLLKRWAVTMILNPVGGWIDGVYWTLIVEIIFYTLVLGILWFDRFRHADRWAFGLTAASAIYWLAVYFTPIHKILPGRVAQFLLLQHGGSFGLGMALWAAMMLRPTRLRYAAIIVGTLASVMEIASMAHSKAAELSVAAIPAEPIALFLLAVAILAVSVWAFKAGLQPGRVGALWCRRFGLATFPLYLLHGIVGGQAIDVFMGAGLGQIQSLMAAEVVAVATALGVAILVEVPLQARLRAAIDAGSARLLRQSTTAHRKTTPAAA